MAFDYKQEYKEFYLPKQQPVLVEVPAMNYVAVRGMGNPNDASGEYQQAMNVLYGIAYSVKMSKMGDHRMDGFFDFVVPPLEGFWWEEVDGKPVVGFDNDKSRLHWVSLIRLPEFVTMEEFGWAASEVARKKGTDCSKAEFLTIEEGLCVQAMHIGPYDDETATIACLHDFSDRNGYLIDIDCRQRFHHEIYLSDPRRVAPERLKTVIRYPIKRAE